MPTYREWLAGKMGATPDAPADPNHDQTSGRYLPGQGDDYTSAVENELLRTGSEAVKGLARSPWDLVKGVLGLPKQVVQGYAALLDHPDPSLLKEIPGALKSALGTIVDPNTDPREMGSLLGQTLLAPKVPGMLKAGIEGAPGAIGGALTKTGEFAEKAGTHPIVKKAQALAPFEAVSGHVGPAVVSAVAPPILEHGGRLLQRAGNSISNLRSALGTVPDAGAAAGAAAEAGGYPEKPADYQTKSKLVKGYSGKQVPGISYDDVTGARDFIKNAEDSAPDYIGAREKYMGDVKKTAIKTFAGKDPAAKRVLEGLMDATKKRVVEPNAFTGNAVDEAPVQAGEQPSEGNSPAGVQRGLADLRAAMKPRVEPNAFTGGGYTTVEDPMTGGRTPASQMKLSKGGADYAPSDYAEDPITDTHVTGGDVPNYMGDLVSGGMQGRAAQMGRDTIESLRAHGYEVPESGFRSADDITRAFGGGRPSLVGDVLGGVDTVNPDIANEAFKRFADVQRRFGR